MGLAKRGREESPPWDIERDVGPDDPNADSNSASALCSDHDEDDTRADADADGDMNMYMNLDADMDMEMELDTDMDLAPALRSAGKDYFSHFWMLDDELSYRATRAGDDVDGTARKTSLINELTKSKVSQRSNDRRLHDHRIAAGHGGRETPRH